MSVKGEYTLKAKVDHPVVVSLPVNRTTGFSWQMSFSSPGLKFRELPYRQHPGGLGAGGLQEFEIEVAQAGEFIIRFQLKRQWETKVRETRTYRIIVTK